MSRIPCKCCERLLEELDSSDNSSETNSLVSSLSSSVANSLDDEVFDNVTKSVFRKIDARILNELERGTNYSKGINRNTKDSKRHSKRVSFNLDTFSSDMTSESTHALPKTSYIKTQLNDLLTNGVNRVTKVNNKYGNFIHYSKVRKCLQKKSLCLQKSDFYKLCPKYVQILLVWLKR